MVLRRSIPLIQAIALEKKLTQAIDLALAHSGLLSTMLIERGLVRVQADNLATYLTLYANASRLSEAQIQGLNALFDLGFQHGLYPAPLRTQDYLIPKRYHSLRFS